MDAPWRMTAWDRERGRGTIADRAGDTLDFDASVALVDDLVVGEGVHVELARSGESFRVVKLWPDDPRVTQPGRRTAVPALDPAVEARVAGVLARMPLVGDYRLRSLDEQLGEQLIVEGDDANFEYGRELELVFDGVDYLELSCRWSGKSIRLANADERAYLGSRITMSNESIGIKIVDSSDHVYFVVCRDVCVRPLDRLKTG